MKYFLILLSSSLIIIIISIFIGENLSFFNTNSFSKNNICCLTEDFSGEIDFDEKIGIFENNKVDIPTEVFDEEKIKVLGLANEEKWIEVDISDQKLYAWEGTNRFLESAVSSGLPWTPTPLGEFRIWIKLRAARMEGGSGRYYYNLPNVPYVMYFENKEVPGYRGFGLHGTYWHNDFGVRRSHGCVNLPTEIAKQLYYWTSPLLPEGKNTVRASADNPGTRIIIHE
ncbi:hypothetical protein A2159_03170 [Candidatus Woesebacteria bacterium RBG_13_34_9]|uniref:L,D-TPase catalytic domain-containing protein n=1 Tax=Candidatus Woesebacteria bacterium RBG_13_34_9 TaxID=1802477 RepID=A0A1F7X6Z9_9BACT|nr:MAG: hypothetical protein A2159_03170 [Candidatus Woesebacteria bacterium RBG_13_34_9]